MKIRRIEWSVSTSRQEFFGHQLENVFGNFAVNGLHFVEIVVGIDDEDPGR